MGKSKKKSYPTTTVDTGLFGKSTTNGKGSTFTPTEFQKNLIGVTENNAVNALNSYLNPDYESEDYKRGDEYYQGKMYGQLQNNYLNPALSRNLLRGSTANDIMRGFANDMATTEYERQNDYRDQQLQNYMASMLPYTTIYDMSKGTQGLSNALANSIAQYNLAQSKGGSGLGDILGGMGSIAGSIAQSKGGGAGGIS